MPQKTWKATFPDGFIVSFVGPTDMSPEDLEVRAKQERGVQEGAIPTTKAGGWMKQMIEGESPSVSTAIDAAAIAAGAAFPPVAPAVPYVMAASPLLARGAKYAEQRATGQNPERPSTQELLTDAAIGAASGFGGNTGGGVLNVVADEAAGATGKKMSAAITRMGGKLSKPISDILSEVTPEVAVESVRNVVKDSAKAGYGGARAAVAEADRLARGISAEDARLMWDNVKTMSPYAAARGASTVGNKVDPVKLQKLLAYYMRWR